MKIKSNHTLALTCLLLAVMGLGMRCEERLQRDVECTGFFQERSDTLQVPAGFASLIPLSERMVLQQVTVQAPFDTIVGLAPTGATLEGLGSHRIALLDTPEGGRVGEVEVLAHLKAGVETVAFGQRRLAGTLVLIHPGPRDVGDQPHDVRLDYFWDGCADQPPRILALAPACGDGVVEGYEECDDENTDIGDGCLGCRIELPVCVPADEATWTPWRCAGEPSECSPQPACTEASCPRPTLEVWGFVHLEGRLEGEPGAVTFHPDDGQADCTCALGLSPTCDPGCRRQTPLCTAWTQETPPEVTFSGWEGTCQGTGVCQPSVPLPGSIGVFQASLGTDLSGLMETIPVGLALAPPRYLLGRDVATLPDGTSLSLLETIGVAQIDGQPVGVAERWGLLVAFDPQGAVAWSLALAPQDEPGAAAWPFEVSVTPTGSALVTLMLRGRLTAGPFALESPPRSERAEINEAVSVGTGSFSVTARDASPVVIEVSAEGQVRGAWMPPLETFEEGGEARPLGMAQEAVLAAGLPDGTVALMATQRSFGAGYPKVGRASVKLWTFGPGPAPLQTKAWVPDDYAQEIVAHDLGVTPQGELVWTGLYEREGPDGAPTPSRVHGDPRTIFVQRLSAQGRALAGDGWPAMYSSGVRSALAVGPQGEIALLAGFSPAGVFAPLGPQRQPKGVHLLRLSPGMEVLRAELGRGEASCLGNGPRNHQIPKAGRVAFDPGDGSLVVAYGQCEVLTQTLRHNTINVVRYAADGALMWQERTPWSGTVESLVAGLTIDPQSHPLLLAQQGPTSSEPTIPHLVRLSP